MIDFRMESFVTGETKWRRVPDAEHSTLCRAFGLDQARFFFDLPSSIRGVGSLSTGNRGRRTINGYVMCGGMDRPWGKLTVCWETEKFRDIDPTDRNDFERLG